MVAFQDIADHVFNDMEAIAVRLKIFLNLWSINKLLHAIQDIVK
jgi:hypothetical protein